MHYRATCYMYSTCYLNVKISIFCKNFRTSTAVTVTDPTRDVAAVRLYLEQQLVFGDALDRFEEVGAERELVTELALTLLHTRKYTRT